MTMIKKKTKKENNKVSFQDFGQFLGWGQKKKNLQKIRQEVILQRSQKKDNQNLGNENNFIINLIKKVIRLTR